MMTNNKMEQDRVREILGQSLFPIGGRNNSDCIISDSFDIEEYIGGNLDVDRYTALFTGKIATQCFGVCKY